MYLLSVQKTAFKLRYLSFLTLFDSNLNHTKQLSWYRLNPEIFQYDYQS